MSERLQPHDMARLESLSGKISGETPRTVSFEGEPLYADRSWSEFHEFSYGGVIPVLIRQVSDKHQVRLDVLYDELTTHNQEFSFDHFLDQIAQSLTEYQDQQNDPDTPVHTQNESYMLDRGENWITELRGQGLTRQFNGTVELHLPQQRPVTLTTKSGRPACAVLDAVYQTTKSEGGVDVAVLVHNTQFKKQQEEMQAVLLAVGQGTIPFDAFVNVFTRQRKEDFRLAAIRHLDSRGQTSEIT